MGGASQACTTYRWQWHIAQYRGNKQKTRGGGEGEGEGQGRGQSRMSWQSHRAGVFLAPMQEREI